MLFDTSVNDKEVVFKINQLVGRPYSFLNAIKKAPIGSSRMEVLAYSPLFSGIMAWKKQSVFGNIGLRPEGILVILPVRLNNYSWVIPYRYLSIYYTDTLTIHAQGEFIRFKISGSQNKKIINKILQEKNKYLAELNYYGNAF